MANLIRFFAYSIAAFRHPPLPTTYGRQYELYHTGPRAFGNTGLPATVAPRGEPPEKRKQSWHVPPGNCSAWEPSMSKIPIKLGHPEDPVVLPVRRAARRLLTESA